MTHHLPFASLHAALLLGRRVVLLAAWGAALGGAAGCGSGAPVDGSCTTAADCRDLETCHEGTCRLLCNVTADCPSDFACSQGACLPRSELTECDGNGDCANTEVCEAGVCVTDQATLLCEDEIDCESDAPLCTSLGVCSSGEATERCGEDADCLSGICLLGECSAGQAGDACEGAADCAAAAPVCLNDVCALAAGALCNNPSECHPSAPLCTQAGVCSDGTAGSACAADDECTEGLCSGDGACLDCGAQILCDATCVDACDTCPGAAWACQGRCATSCDDCPEPSPHAALPVCAPTCGNAQLDPGEDCDVAAAAAPPNGTCDASCRVACEVDPLDAAAFFVNANGDGADGCESTLADLFGTAIFVASVAGDAWDGDDLAGCGLLTVGATELFDGTPCATITAAMLTYESTPAREMILVLEGRYEEEVYFAQEVYNDRPQGGAVRGGFARADLRFDPEHVPSVVGPPYSATAVTCDTVTPGFYQQIFVVPPPPALYDPTIDVPPVIEGFTLQGAPGANCLLRIAPGLTIECEATPADCFDLSSSAAGTGFLEHGNFFTAAGFERSLNASVVCNQCAMRLRRNRLRPDGSAGTISTGVYVHRGLTEHVVIEANDIVVPHNELTTGVLVYDSDLVSITDNAIATAALQDGLVRGTLVFADGSGAITIARNRMRLTTQGEIFESYAGGNVRYCSLVELEGNPFRIASNTFEMDADCAPHGSAGVDGGALRGVSVSIGNGGGGMLAFNTFINTRGPLQNSSAAFYLADIQGASESMVFQSNLVVDLQKALLARCDGTAEALMIANVFDGVEELRAVTAPIAGIAAADVDTLNGGSTTLGASTCDFSASAENQVLSCALLSQPGPPAEPRHLMLRDQDACLGAGSLDTSAHQASTVWDAPLAQSDANRVLRPAIDPDPGAVHRP